MEQVRPGQIDPNVFESAILGRIASEQPALCPHLAHLRVLSREFTGVGSYTTFQCENCEAEIAEGQYILKGLIHMPGVAFGMGAVLFCKEGQPDFLETFTYDGSWCKCERPPISASG
jgi:hypothetical protein